MEYLKDAHSGAFKILTTHIGGRLPIATKPILFVSSGAPHR